MWIYFNEHPLRCMNVHLKKSSFIQGRIQQCQQALYKVVSNSYAIGSSGTKPTWCVISGLASAMSLPVLARMPWWSSQFNRVYFTSPSPFLFLPLLLLPPPDIRYVSRHACSRITYRRRVDVAIPPRWTCACTGSIAGLGTLGTGVWVFGEVVDNILRSFAT
jgi:hypothetical protein